MTKSERKLELAKLYAKLAKSLGRYPVRSDLVKEGLSRETMRSVFGDMDALKTFSRNEFSNYFDRIIDPDFFNSESFAELKQEVKKYKRFVITTAVAGAPVHEDFYDSIKTYCAKQDALLLILPANYALYDLPQDLVTSERIVFRDLRLNSNLLISAIKIDPKAIDPTTSLDDLGGHEGTVIIGSPKQRRRPIANGSSSMAHIIQATGAITRPRYVPKSGEPKRRDTLATAQHVLGCVIVEIVNDKLFHFRQVEANKDGSFNDLFSCYDGDYVTKSKVEAIIQGDYHNGDTDEQADKACDEMCAFGRPKYRVLHDFFDGKSINHHEMENQVRRAQQAAQGKTSLVREINALGKTLEDKLTLGTSDFIFIVPSNHDDFINRYLQKGHFFDDHNRLASIKLQAMAIEGKNVLESWLKEVNGFTSDKVIWGQVGQDFKVTKKRIEINAHGHKGANGKHNPGSEGMRKSFGNVTYGHCHYGEINHGARSVGTTSFLKLDYNQDGPSSWGHAHDIIYSDGTRQLVNVIKGHWRLVD